MQLTNILSGVRFCNKGSSEDIKKAAVLRRPLIVLCESDYSAFDTKNALPTCAVPL